MKLQNVYEKIGSDLDREKGIKVYLSEDKLVLIGFCDDEEQNLLKDIKFESLDPNNVQLKTDSKVILINKSQFSQKIKAEKTAETSLAELDELQLADTLAKQQAISFDELKITFVGNYFIYRRESDEIMYFEQFPIQSALN